MATSADARSRAEEQITVAARSGLDLVGFWRAVTPTLARMVPHVEGPCFFSVDPGSRLITSHFQEGLPDIPTEWLAREYTAPDYNSMADVFESPDGLGTLHDATGGRPERAAKFHEEMVPFGCEQELVLALRTSDGETWGSLGLYREPGARLFSDTDKQFLRTVAPALAEGARRGLLQGEASEPDLPDAPGVVTVDPSLHAVSFTESALPLLAALDGSPDTLPAAVVAVAGAVLGGAEDEPQARTRTKQGGWLVLHGSRLVGSAEDGPRALVIVEQASQARLAPLLMRAYQLTARERDVAGLVLAGRSTAECARALSIAEDTVQQHLQRVFDKTGVRSRRELRSQVFGAHFVPRVRDNEQRTAVARAARGGPMPG